MVDYSFDFLFIGGGILGSACSMALAKGLEERGMSANIAVIDLDLEGEHSSTLKNAGGVRATWRNRANIELCNFSIDFYESIRDEIQFRELGYYWMHGDESWDEINKNYALYEEYGLPVELHSTGKISEFLPFVDNVGGVAGLSISRKAGLLDHYSLREYYRREARVRGVGFFDRIFVNEILLKDKKVDEVRAYDLKKLLDESVEPSELIRHCLVKGVTDTNQETITFKCGVLINTAGAWAPVISNLYNFDDEQIKPRRRQMVLMSCPEVDLSNYGMIIDTSNIYFHKEGKNILAGYSNMDEPYGFNFDFSFHGMDEESMFVKYIWQPLWRRSSKLEKVKLLRGWAGVYAETRDRSGHIGKVNGLRNVYECVAHTGRGLMISYGAAMALSDLILDSKIREELRHAKDMARERPSGALFEELHL
ncbi:FAD-binding oxidoreductase [Desulfobacterota bacterium AH_259_B03_O07]|nr:FAD-binding oxidoreductase [Desulfobacterota bacterium AH_259_B03_O07]